jgi:hypothetical protein
MSLRLEPLMQVAADVGDVVSLGTAPGGERRVVAITGGTFTGKELSGEVLSGGADWQVKWEDGTLSIDAHYALRELRRRGHRSAQPGPAHGRARRAGAPGAR